MFRMNRMLKSRKTNRISHFRLFSQDKVAEFFVELKDGWHRNINTLYHRLDKIIIDKREIADRNRKKLLITVGDKHDEKNSIVTHLTVVELAKKHGINHLAVEMPETILNLILTGNLETLRKYQNTSNSNFDPTIKIAMQKGMTIHPVDLPFNQWPASSRLQFLREKYMIDQLLQLDQNLGFMIAALHLLPIYNHPKLKEKYEILCINSYKSTKEELAEFDMTNDQSKCMAFAN